MTRKALSAMKTPDALACMRLSALCAMGFIAVPATADPPQPDYWIAAGQGGTAPHLARYEDGQGEVEVLLASGPVNMKDHPFFTPLGENGRACVTCHQPSSGMGLSVETIRKRWQETQGRDPLFAAIDGSNCPSLAQEKPDSHSLLLNRGLFRVSLPWPRTTGPDGTPVNPEFTIELVRDPTGCNTDPQYGLHSPDPHISIFRRPRIAANLKYLAVDAGAEMYGGVGPFNAKRLAMVLDRDPETGRYMSMNIMSDARDPTLKIQAAEAARDHLQVRTALTDAQLQQIVTFESQIYAAQGVDTAGDDFSAPGAPPALGAHNLRDSPTGVLGDSFGNPAFKTFDAWLSGSGSARPSGPVPARLSDSTAARPSDSASAPLSNSPSARLSDPAPTRLADSASMSGSRPDLNVDTKAHAPNTPSATPPAQQALRESVARGYDIFFNRPFWIRDVSHINTVGFGNPAKRTCVTCHNLQMVGTDASAGWGDLGTTNEPWAGEPLYSPRSAIKPELPLFKVVCNPQARPHPFLGRVIYTHDPGRALISGKCYDVGSIVMGQLRALAARPPYFSNGSAEDLRAVVDFYDRRFNMALTQQEKTDLVNFMSVL